MEVVLTSPRPPADSSRNSTKPSTDRARNDSNILSDQPTRRPVAERHISRNSGSMLKCLLCVRVCANLFLQTLTMLSLHLPKCPSCQQRPSEILPKHLNPRIGRLSETLIHETDSVFGIRRVKEMANEHARAATIRCVQNVQMERTVMDGVR
jgi:hypothetical protein